MQEVQEAQVQEVQVVQALRNCITLNFCPLHCVDCTLSTAAGALAAPHCTEWPCSTWGRTCRRSAARVSPSGRSVALLQ